MAAAAREWRKDRRIGCEDSERRNGGSWEEMGLRWWRFWAREMISVSVSGGGCDERWWAAVESSGVPMAAGGLFWAGNM